MVGRNGTPDLNTLAHEMTNSNVQSESRIARPSSKLPPPLKSRRSQSALDHHSHTRHTPSPTEVVTSTTTSHWSSSNSSNEGPGVKSYEQPTISSSAKTSSRPNSSNSHYRMGRQGSFGSQTNLSTTSTESFKSELKKKKSQTNLDSIDGGGSGRATPTSGHSNARKKGRDVVDSGSVSSTIKGLPPRTPYRY